MGEDNPELAYSTFEPIEPACMEAFTLGREAEIAGRLIIGAEEYNGELARHVFIEREDGSITLHEQIYPRHDELTHNVQIPHVLRRLRWSLLRREVAVQGLADLRKGDIPFVVQQTGEEGHVGKVRFIHSGIPQDQPSAA